MKVRHGILLGLLCVCASAQAHAASPAQQVQTIEQAYQQLETLQADFTQSTFVKTLGRTMPNHGVLYIKRPGKLRIEYHGTPPRHYVSNGKHLWIYTPGDKQVMKEKLGKSGIPREALSFLQGFEHLSDMFTVARGTRDEGRGTKLTLTPKSSSGFRRLDCAFGADGLLQDMIVHNDTGGTATYRFTNLQRNPTLPDALFRYRR